MGQEITRVYAAGRKGLLTSRGVDTYDAIQALVHFGDTFVTFETCWVIPNSWPSVVDSTLGLYGTSGRIEIDQNDQGMSVATDRLETAAPYGRFESHGKLMGFYLEGIRHFVDGLAEDREPVVSGEDGLAATRAVAAIQESILTGTPIDLAPH